MTKVKERVQIAEERTNTNPTEGQKRSGNYKKGKVTIKGLKISIENPKDSVRKGVGEDGKEWYSKMKFAYGYFNGTVGKDGDPIDVYLGPKLDEKFDVYIIDQVEVKSRAFDEHKVMLGFGSKEEAKKAYMSCYESGWTGFQNITTITLARFKQWITNRDAIKYPASRLNMSSKVDIKNVELQEGIHLIELKGEVLDGETLKDLQAQAGDLSDAKSLIVEIASPGGSVSEGLQIMVWLDSLSQSGIEVITAVVANAYSIASLIMLAADTRLISTHGKVMVHNPMVPELQYANADQLEKYARELRELEALMYQLYEIYTGLETDAIKALMDNETYLSPEQSVQNGFADMVVDLKPKPFVEAVNLINNLNMSKLVNSLNKVIAKINNSDFVNQMYYDSEGGEIEISQADASTYQKGDKTSVENGEVKLADGAKLTIVDGKIEGIDKSIDEGVAEDSATEEVADEASAEFNEGPAPGETLEKPVDAEGEGEEIVEAAEEAKAEDAEEAPVEIPADDVAEEAAEEVVEEAPAAEEGEQPIKEAAEELIEDAPVEEPVVAPVEAPVAPIEEASKMSQETLKKFSKLESKIEQLEKEKQEMLSMFEAKFSAIDKAFVDLNKFEEVATEAIDAIATSTVSNFKPSAKVVAEEKSTGSIFERMKAKRGLK